MLKEIKYLIFFLIVSLFIFLTSNYYFSDAHKKKSYRLQSNINKKIEIYSENIPTLNDNTQNIIEYVKNTQTKKKKKYYFWELLSQNE